MIKKCPIKLREFRHSVVAFLLLIALAVPCSVQAEPLYGSAELDRRLPSLDPTLAPGNTFDEEIAKELLIPTGKAGNEWFRIPNWLAGTWKKKEAVTTFYRNWHTGKVDETPRAYKAESEGSWGDEVDREQDTWQKVNANYMTQTLYDNNEILYAFILEYKPINTAETWIETKSRSISFLVDNDSKKILDTYQRQTLSRETKISDTLLRTESFHRTFDWQGNVSVEAVNVSNERKVERFISSGHRNEFVAYLRSHGLERLIPQTADEIWDEEMGPAKAKPQSSIKDELDKYFDARLGKQKPKATTSKSKGASKRPVKKKNQ